jgi:hypothetical protein
MAGALPFIKEEEKRRITTQPYRILNPGTNPVTKGLQQRVTPPLWPISVSTTCLPRTGGQISISPHVASTAIDFSIIYEIATML